MRHWFYHYRGGISGFCVSQGGTLGTVLLWVVGPVPTLMQLLMAVPDHVTPPCYALQNCVEDMEQWDDDVVLLLLLTVG